MKAGRELEVLVAKIKEMLHPEARIESPTYVKDKDTGERREVDVGIWSPAPRGEIFVAVECRDRGATQDVTWIEQLISKKESVGADVLIAVTASSFTQPAVVKAAKRGVLIRTMSNVLAEEIALWTKEAYLEIRSVRVEISDAVFDTTVGKVIGKYGTRLLFNSREETFDEFAVQRLVAMLPSVNATIPNEGNRRQVRITGKGEGLDVLLPYSARVKAYEFHSVVTRQVQTIPVASGFSYDDAAAASRLVEGYQFSSHYGAVGDVLIKSDTNEGQLTLDFSNYTSWVDQVILKAGEPIALRSLVVFQPQFRTTA